MAPIFVVKHINGEVGVQLDGPAGVGVYLLHFLPVKFNLVQVAIDPIAHLVQPTEVRGVVLQVVPEFVVKDGALLNVLLELPEMALEIHE